MATHSPPATIRPLRPADLVFLASLWATGKPPFGAAYRNEAQTWERLGLADPGFRLLGKSRQFTVSFAVFQPVERHSSL